MVSLLQKCKIFFITSRNHDAHVKDKAMIKRERTENDQQTTKQKTKDRTTRIPLKSGGGLKQSIYGYCLPLWYLQTFLKIGVIPSTAYMKINLRTRHSLFKQVERTTDRRYHLRECAIFVIKKAGSEPTHIGGRLVSVVRSSPSFLQT
jgi:hypothetical protein